MMKQDNLTSLPMGWVWTTLGEIAEFQYGKGLPQRKRDPQGTIPVYGSNGVVGYHSVPLTTKACLIIGRKGAVGETHISKGLCWPIDTTYFIYPPNGVDIDFLYYLIRTIRPGWLDRSTAIPGLNRNDAYVVPIPLPPSPEQHRIVAKIEKLFTKIDAAVEALNKVKAQVKSYRQAVLKHAFEGKLTKEWREAHKGEMEPASALLERIREERQRHTKGKAKDLPRIDTSDLPRGWVAVRVGDVLQKIPLTGKKLKQSQYQADGPLPVIDQGCSFIGGYTDKEELEICCDSPVIVFGDHTKIIKYVDFRFVVGGDGVKVLKPFNVFSPKLFYYFLQAVEIPEKGYARHYQFLEKAAVPLPPFPEQHRIVEEIERRFSVADEIEKAAERGLKKAESLRQSILKKAFEGKLVPQDPSEEPAEKLLERIKAGKGSTKDKSKSARSNRRQSVATQRRLI